MKKFFVCLALLSSLPAFAQSWGCGYGNLEKNVQCEITSSALYEAGYSEILDQQVIRLNGRYANRGSARVDGVGVVVEYRIGAAGPQLQVKLDRAVQGIGQLIAAAVEYPETCRGSALIVSVSGVSEAGRDFSVSCQAEVEFVED